MTANDVSSPANPCPACDSLAVEYWEAVDSSVCSECGYVLRESPANLRDTSSIDVDTGNETPDSSASSRWRDRISVKDKSEANLVEVLELAEDTATVLSLPEETTTRAAEIVTTAWETNFMHGRTKPVTVGAAVYLASREVEATVPPGAIANELGVENGRMKKTYRKLKSSQEVDLSPPVPQDYVEYLCDELVLPEETVIAATDLLDTNKLPGGNPVGVAAAGVYEVTESVGPERTLREVASVAKLTKETVWRHAVELRTE